MPYLSSINPEKISKIDVDREVVRSIVIAELDNIYMYEHVSEVVECESVKKELMGLWEEKREHLKRLKKLFAKLDGKSCKKSPKKIARAKK